MHRSPRDHCPPRDALAPGDAPRATAVPGRRWTALPLVVVMVVALVLAGCSGADEAGDDATEGAVATSDAVTAPATPGTAATSPSPTAAPSPTDTATTTDDSGDPDGDVTVAVAASELGDILVDGAGMTLYVFDQDGDATSACTGDCLDNWPPLVAAEPVAGPGVLGELGTFERADTGQRQVMVEGAPLYLWAGDGEPGDVTGHGVGDVWWAVTPSGEAVPSTAAAAGGDEANLAEGVDDGGY